MISPVLFANFMLFITNLASVDYLSGVYRFYMQN